MGESAFEEGGGMSLEFGVLGSEFGVSGFEGLTRLREISGRLSEEAKALEEDVKVVLMAAGELEAAIVALEAELAGGGEDVVWFPPIGTVEFPPESWYVSVYHDPVGVGINSGWYATHGHTGCDFNIDEWPWGDVDRGAEVRAITTGRVTSRGSSKGWLGVVVVEHDDGDGLVYARYAHLDADRFEVQVRDEVAAGQLLGYLGDYQGGDGGDHLHFGTAKDPFDWWMWLPKGVRFFDPRPFLEERLGAELVKRMFGRGDG